MSQEGRETLFQRVGKCLGTFSRGAIVTVRKSIVTVRKFLHTAHRRAVYRLAHCLRQQGAKSHLYTRQANSPRARVQLGVPLEGR